MLNCREATQLLSEAQDRELGRGEKLSLRFHTLLCRACANFGIQMVVLGDLSRRYAEQDDVIPSEIGDPEAPESQK